MDSRINGRKNRMRSNQIWSKNIKKTWQRLEEGIGKPVRYVICRITCQLVHIFPSETEEFICYYYKESKNDFLMFLFFKGGLK